MIETSEIISRNSGKNTRTPKDSVNNSRDTCILGNNKEKEQSEVKKKAVSPTRLDSHSITFISFEMETPSSKNEELEIKTNISTDQTKVSRDSKGIGTSEIICSDNEKIMITKMDFLNMSIDWQIDLETIRKGSIVTLKRKSSLPKDQIESQQNIRLFWTHHLRMMN